MNPGAARGAVMSKSIRTVAALACLLLAACSAGPERARVEASAGAGRGLIMGTLVGRDASVAILATAAGTRYDVRGPDGALIAAGLTADGVARRTGQDPRGAWAGDQDDQPVMLMMAEPMGLGRD